MKNLNLRRLREIAKLNLIFPPLKFLKRRKKINPKRKYVAKPLLSPEEVKELESKIPSIAAINLGVLKEGLLAKDAADAFAFAMRNLAFETKKAAIALKETIIQINRNLERGKAVKIKDVLYVSNYDYREIKYFLIVEGIKQEANKKLNLANTVLDANLELIDIRLDMKFDELTKKYCHD